MIPMPLSEFADKMNEIMPAMMKDFSRMQPAEIYKGKITLPQVLILQYLSTQEPVKMTDIANFMKVSTAATTGIVDRLVKSGYVSRVFDQDDRRIIRIKITLKGMDLMRKIAQERRSMVIHVFGKISEKDRQDYLRVIMRVKDILSGGEVA
jgi:DNA-binding MarR family transcriptional regulator